MVAVLVVGALLLGAVLLICARRLRSHGPRREPRHEPLPPTGRTRPGPMHPSACEIAVSRQEKGRRLPGRRW